MAIPKSAGKFSLEELQKIERLDWSDDVGVTKTAPALYHQEIEGFKFDFLWHPSQLPDSNRLFVMFSGDAMRNKYDPPVFQRWSWGPFFPGHCLFVADPSLHLHERLGLAWYGGTNRFDPMPHVALKIQAICDQLGIAARDVYSYGSSGGGFAAIRMLNFCPEAGAIAINPQTCITDYERSSTERYLQVCFHTEDRATGLSRYPKRLDLKASADTLKERRIMLIQNTMDEHHYEEHYKPFCAALGTGEDHAPDASPMHRILFAHEGGHKKAESQDVFDTTMQMVVDGRF